MRRLVSTALATLLFISAAAQGAIPESRIYSGIYIGAKGDTIILCDGSGPYLVTARERIKQLLREYYRSTGGTPDQPIYISFLGVLLDGLLDGLPAKAQGMFQVTAVLERSESAPASCKNATRLGLPVRKTLTDAFVPSIHLIPLPIYKERSA
jgi:hypothetical protein